MLQLSGNMVLSFYKYHSICYKIIRQDIFKMNKNAVINCDDRDQMTLSTTPMSSSFSLPVDTTQPQEESVILITGGYNDRRRVEYVTTTGERCQLPSLNEERGGHTQNGFLACGGKMEQNEAANRDSCSQFVNGTWSNVYNLSSSREWHMSWNSPQGVVLIGGTFHNSVELLEPDGNIRHLYSFANNSERSVLSKYPQKLQYQEVHFQGLCYF